MKVSYSVAWDRRSENYLDTAIQEHLWDVSDYAKCGVVEAISERVENTNESYSALVQLLVEKDIISLEEMNYYIACIDAERI